MKQHLMRNFHVDVCRYCPQDFQDVVEWKSEFHGELHYKSTKCGGCGRNNTIRVDFHGSGHDAFSSELDIPGTRFEAIVQAEHLKVKK